MGSKRYKPEEIVTKQRQVEVLVGRGMARVNAIREVRITEQTCYRWRKHYGGMGTDHIQLPSFEAFFDAQSFYATLAHESLHSNQAAFVVNTDGSYSLVLPDLAEGEGYSAAQMLVVAFAARLEDEDFHEDMLEFLGDLNAKGRRH